MRLLPENVVKNTFRSAAFWRGLKRDMMKKDTASIVLPSKPDNPHPLAADTAVVLLGWAGAKEQHLAKYSELYGDRGFSTLQFTASFDGRHPLYLKHGRDITAMVPQLDKVIAEKPNLIFHTYSMNGVFALCALMYRKGYENILGKSIGIVMDSGPVYFDDVSGYAEVLEVIFEERTRGMGNTEKTAALLFKKFLTSHMHITYMRGKFMNRFFNTPIEAMDAYEFLKNHPQMPRHQMYLYSDTDTICKAYMIKAFHEHQSSKGSVVDYVNFRDSEHVAHFRNYPEKYTEAVDRFLEKIWEDKQGEIPLRSNL